MLTTHRTVGLPTALRTAAVAGFLAVVPLTLTACSSGSTAAPATSAAVVTSTSDAVVTQTDVVTDTAEVTRTRTTEAGGGGGGTSADPTTGGGGTSADPTTGGGGGGGNSSGSDTPQACPDPATLGAVTPNYDPNYPINAINCGGEWAVGTYEADGKNQTTAIWRNSGGSWTYQDRTAICATADNLPQELYAQACEGN